jgi:hypothetical protein
MSADWRIVGFFFYRPYDRRIFRLFDLLTFRPSFSHYQLKSASVNILE